MKNTSEYSINKKHKDAIVYIDAFGCEIRLTVNDFQNEDEFRHWKDWSNKNYHQQKKSQNRYESHTLPETALSDSQALTPSAEDQLLRKKEIEECWEILRKVQKVLTPRQFRRLVMYLEDGMNEEEIGRAEGVTQQMVSKSLQQGIGRVYEQQKKIFSESSKKGCKNGSKNGVSEGTFHRSPENEP